MQLGREGPAPAILGLTCGTSRSGGSVTPLLAARPPELDVVGRVLTITVVELVDKFTELPFPLLRLASLNANFVTLFVCDHRRLPVMIAVVPTRAGPNR